MSPGPSVAAQRPPGLRFSERMRGRIQRLDGTELDVTLTLTVDIEDVEGMLADPEHPGAFSGLADMGPQTLRIGKGRLNLLVVDPDTVERRTMRYVGTLTALGGEESVFVAYKELRNDGGFEVWKDTTTLFFAWYDSHDLLSASCIGRGTLRVDPADFVRQLATMRVTNAMGIAQRLDVLAEFGRFFVGVLVDTYARHLARARVVTPDAPPLRGRPGPLPPAPGPDGGPHGVPPAGVRGRPPIRVDTGDGSHVRLQRFPGGPRGPVILSPGFGMSSLCFAIPTIETNLLEHLYAHRYDVWLFDYRASPDLPTAGMAFTVDDIARRDYPAAVRHVLAESAPPDGKVQLVVHCVGSLSLLMALCAGELPGKIRSVVCSQLGLHPVAPPLNQLKAGLYMATLLHAAGLRRLDSDYDERRWGHWLLDRLLRFYPSRERCNNPVCRRIFFILGESFRHAQLNTATHEAIRDMFGVTSLRALRHLARMLREQRAVDGQGDDLYLPHLDRLGIPILFLHGALNEEFSPGGTCRTVQALRALEGQRPGAAGGSRYEYELIAGYGHLDCIIGRRAARDVFPLITAHLDRHQPR